MKYRKIGALLLVLTLLLAQHACGEGRIVELADYRALHIAPEAVEISDAYVEEQIQYMLGLYAQQDATGVPIVPELTDEFVQENLGDASVEAYRERLRGILYQEAREAVLRAGRRRSFRRCWSWTSLRLPRWQRCTARSTRRTATRSSWIGAISAGNISV